jgi:hypothetical protein
MKKFLPLILILIIALLVNKQRDIQALKTPLLATAKIERKEKKTAAERQLFTEERFKHEYNIQKNPFTGLIPQDEKILALNNSISAREKQLSYQPNRSNNFSILSSSVYSSRGPSNFGGRTRDLVVDISDPTSNTIIAGGVSSGVFRTTNGGTSWVKVSANDEIHNVTAIAQDPRPGFQNIWYYGTGERLGNSATLGGFNYLGNGIWKSTDGGLTWNQIPETNSNYTSLDSYLDFISAIEVSPTTGDLFIAAAASIYRYDGTTLTTELGQDNNTYITDVLVNSDGRVYAAFDGRDSENGVWTSPTGNGSWTRIAQNTTTVGWESTGRIVLGAAPSNENIVYALFNNGDEENIEADFWKYDAATGVWTDYTSKLPDEPGGDLKGNDPFAIQSGYDLVVSVKPDDENFVTIGGTNAYKIENLVSDATFTRIGGYANNLNYGTYNVGGTKHHPDIHALVYDPNNANILFSGTDGGVHKTTDINAGQVAWESLNNNYITYQFYHIAMDPTQGGNLVIGGAQDNGTKYGGTDVGLADNTTMSPFYGGDGVAVGVALRGENSNNVQFYFGSQEGNIRTNYPSSRELTPDGSDSQFVTYFYLDPDNTEQLYYAGKSILYKTNDAENVTTSTWDNLGALANSENLKSFATTRGTYDASSSYLLIGGDHGGIYRLDDPKNATALSNAVDITPSQATTVEGTIVSGLAIHPTNPDIVLAVYGNYGINNIFVTEDATSNAPTWSLVENNLNAHSIRSAAIAAFPNEDIYFVGTGRGLYASSDPKNNDWEMEGANEIGLAVVSALALRPSDNKLLIGTHGNGMFETTVSGTLSIIDNTSSAAELTLFPTPTASELHIKFRDSYLNEKMAYEIITITGKRVLSGFTKNSKVDVASLNPGIYIFSLRINDETKFSKFIKK